MGFNKIIVKMSKNVGKNKIQTKFFFWNYWLLIVDNLSVKEKVFVIFIRKCNFLKN